ncbi:DUF2059 domain-containing protein [Yoonia sp. SS1-5]|uniref:DUF2059 domain-containing protein n=1 Tax=Yoonia rhodophyticola TaxID=3137370 RepID=A0AAN0MBJ9_9RHOB
MLRHLTAISVAISMAVGAGAAFAQQSHAEKTDALFAVLGLDDILSIMRTEGLAYGETIAADMFPGNGGPQWNAMVSQIYDEQMMFEEVRGALGEELEGDDIDAMLAFFSTPLGEKIIGLEVSARRALLDDAVEAASKDSAAIAMADETDAYLRVKEFVTVNDLIETNVVGALNSNYAFYMGLMDGGAMPESMTPDTALNDIWSQEDQIRADTTEWIYSFLLMAYQPLTADELRAYTKFSQTEAGKDMNAALFVAFNGMFDDISRSLGLAASRFLISQEL